METLLIASFKMKSFCTKEQNNTGLIDKGFYRVYGSTGFMFKLNSQYYCVKEL